MEDNEIIKVKEIIDEKNNPFINNHSDLDISKYNISEICNDEDISKFKEIQFKLIVIGDIRTGKSSIINSLVKGTFKDNYQATIGFDIFKYRRKVNDIIININIWDTCGLIDFSSCTTNLYKDAIIGIIVYEIDKRESFENIQNWANILKLNSRSDVIIIIVGNKSDLEDKREVKKEEGIEFSKIYNYCLFFETSAKNNISIKELFEQVFEQLYLHYKKNMITDEEDESREYFHKRKETIILNKKNHNKKKRNNKNHCCNIY